MLTDLATGIAEHFRVTVVTSRKLYNDPSAQLTKHDEYQGVNIVRLNTTRLGRTHLWRRVFDYLSFSSHVLVFLLAHIREGDLVVLNTDPPLLSLLNTTAVRLRGGQVVNWIHDVFPEIAVQLGVFPSNRVFSAPLIWWRNRTLRAAKVNVVISRKMQELFVQQGIANTRYIPNWSDGEQIQPMRHADNPMRAEWNPENRFLVGYSGNFGRAHSFDELVEAMVLLKDRKDIGFVLVGEGVALQFVRDAVDRMRLTNVCFKPYQESQSLSSALGAIDLHLVSLKAGMEGLLLPSKLYGAMAAGRPIAFVGDTGGEIAQLVLKHDFGIVTALGDGAGLAQHIRSLAQDGPRREAFQQRARAVFERAFSRCRSADQWLQLLRVLPSDAADSAYKANSRSAEG